MPYFNGQESSDSSIPLKYLPRETVQLPFWYHSYQLAVSFLKILMLGFIYKVRLLFRSVDKPGAFPQSNDIGLTQNGLNLTRKLF